jgi:hypothetical protein
MKKTFTFLSGRWSTQGKFFFYPSFQRFVSVSFGVLQNHGSCYATSTKRSPIDWHSIVTI